MIVINPVLIGIIIHTIIFNYVHSSSRRIQPSTHISGNDANHPQPQRINRRDTHLIRHIIVMFSMFLAGWSPIYIFLIIIPDFFFTLLLSSCLILLAQLCVLFDIINLYAYNHELRKYLQNTIFKCNRV